jgi:hypothetical protein
VKSQNVKVKFRNRYNNGKHPGKPEMTFAAVFSRILPNAVKFFLPLNEGCLRADEE